MTTIKFNTKQFNKEMTNIINYSVGFLEGTKRGKQQFLHILGVEVIALLKQYIDSSARVNPSMLHHVYEWGQTGSPDSRLFDIDYTVSGLGLSFRSTFRQSNTIKDGSNVPFYNKAMIMERGIPVTIKPKRAQVLAFEDNGETVFTAGPIIVENPGGNTQGQFEKVYNTFFSQYFTQAFLRASGVMKYLDNPVAYKKNLTAGSRLGKNKGIETGYRWIVNAGVAK